MRVIKTYVAEDGTTFDNEQECAEYEEELRINTFADTALLFDEEGNKMPLSAMNFERAIYIKAVTDEAAAFMAEEFRYCDNPWWNSDTAKAGCWVFFGDAWRPIEDILEMARIIEQIS